MSDARPAIFISGAGAGIGRTTAELFASRGWFVGLFDVAEEAVAAVRAELGEGIAVDGRLDVTDPGRGTRRWRSSGRRAAGGSTRCSTTRG